MGQDENSSRRLGQAIREIRIAHAERHDALVELRDMERARLHLLAEALEGLRAEVPADNEEITLSIIPGDPPRFWVDPTSFVMLGRDKRVYQFLKDTRAGRTVLAESAEVPVIADAVTRYVAERVVERDRIVEADWLVSKQGSGRNRVNDYRGTIWGLVGFGLGMLAGAVLLIAYSWVTHG